MDIALSLASLTVIALILGAIALFRRGGYGKQAWLMLVLAAVIAINIGIMTLPTPQGEALVNAAPAE